MANPTPSTIAILSSRVMFASTSATRVATGAAEWTHGQPVAAGVTAPAAAVPRAKTMANDAAAKPASMR